MQFFLPFIKAVTPPSSGNLPQVPQQETTEQSLNTLQGCDGGNDNSLYLVQEASTPPPTPPSVVSDLQNRNIK